VVGAEDSIRESIAVYARDAAADPKPLRWRILAKAYKNLAEIQKRTSNNAEALETIRSSIRITEDLLQKDPKNETYQIDRQQAWLMEIDLLLSNHLEDQAKAETRRALETMKTLADQPDTPFHHAADYAELLVTTPFRDLRDNPAALRYAHKAANLTREFDPEVLHVLALAYQANGDYARAAEADRKALLLLPKASDFRSTVEAGLARNSK
jgi:tetratricopeptide (TPR) repeat protein